MISPQVSGKFVTGPLTQPSVGLPPFFCAASRQVSRWQQVPETHDWRVGSGQAQSRETPVPSSIAPHLPT